MVCSCGGSCRVSSNKFGEDVFTCPSCGRREAFIPAGRNILSASFEERPAIDFTVRPKSPPQAMDILEMPPPIVVSEGLQETLDLFDRTVKNLLTMPPMPRKRRKP